MEQNSVSRESAEEQMELLLDYYEIEKDDIVSEHGKDALQTIYNRLVSAIEKGRLEISLDDNNELSIMQHLKFPPGEVGTIRYGILTAQAKLTMDAHGENKSNAKMHALMGAISGEGPAAMKKLRGVDLGIMERLALVFMVV